MIIHEKLWDQNMGDSVYLNSEKLQLNISPLTAMILLNLSSSKQGMINKP